MTMEKANIIVESGKKCPVSGMWKIAGDITTTQPLSKDLLMPTYCGKKVRWILLYPA